MARNGRPTANSSGPRIYAGLGDDQADGGAGNDTIFGDASGSGGIDASIITLSSVNVRSGSETSTGDNNAQIGDSVIYDNVATLAGGGSLSARLTYIANTDTGMPVDLTGGSGAEILLNSGGSKHMVYLIAFVVFSFVVIYYIMTRKHVS